nr:immunoglobulin light chain junction region [Macaca mulatta]MOX11590.1 immunoglobulin light chain junction region [Macaca mulatta]MOX12774.1 immunoglobulin light chain junction region [Macaca mulatta]MOX12793.1 immunoglobulin light chain junction region [Macaca mulatta]
DYYCSSYSSSSTLVF